MTALAFVALAALCGAINIHLNVKYATSDKRDRAAPWGVAACAASWGAVVSIVVVISA